MTIHDYANPFHLLADHACLHSIVQKLIQALLDLQYHVPIDHSYQYAFEGEHISASNHLPFVPVILLLLVVQDGRT